MLAFLLTCVAALPAVFSSQPHIVFILADDMGWDDVSFHGSRQIPTPNLDVLAAEGIVLNNYYAMHLCTPSRSALLTGLHPIRTGMQSAAISNMAPWGLPLHLRLMPEHFKDLGYDVHMIGKWHLGFFRSEYTPLRRGFDTFYGYYTGLVDYFDHTSGAEHVGLDLRDNEAPVWKENGTYATHLFTNKFVSLIENHGKSKPFFGYFSHLAPHSGRTVDPFQAPEELVRKFSYIGDRERTYYAGMVAAMDQSVGAVVEALSRAGMLNDTIIVFSSDNGAIPSGPFRNSGSNWPLRGTKGTLWEGATRVPAFVWSTRLRKRFRVSRQMMHIVDWLPTLYSAAGGNVSALGATDGVDMWLALSEGSPSPRQEILLNADPVFSAMAIRAGRYKLLLQAPGDNVENDRHPTRGLSRPGNDLVQLRANSRTARVLESIYGRLHHNDSGWLQDATVSCSVSGSKLNPPGNAPYLFDIESDPCETRNLATSHKRVLQSLLKKLAVYVADMVPPRMVPEDPRSDPENFGGVWSPWRD